MFKAWKFLTDIEKALLKYNKKPFTSHLGSVILNLFFLLLQVNVYVNQSFIFWGFVTDILKLLCLFLNCLFEVFLWSSS